MGGELKNRIEQKGVLLADGATGTNFFNMGLQSGDAPELWNDEQPQKVTELHDSFINAGADIILSNTFGCNHSRLKLHNAQDRVRELNIKAAELAKKSAEKNDALVAGSVGPTGELFEPLGTLKHEEAVNIFFEQMNALKEGGADVLWIETMSAAEEINAAAEAAKKTNMDFVITASFDTAGRTMMGLSPSNLVELASVMEPKPAAIGANCGVGATDLLFSLLDIVDKPCPFVVIAKANCGVPQIKGDQVVYSGTPELMGEYAKLAINAGAKIVGGCCGTAPEHLTVMRNAIDNHKKQEPPSLPEIVEQTGPLVNEIATKTKRKKNRRRNQSN